MTKRPTDAEQLQQAIALVTGLEEVKSWPRLLREKFTVDADVRAGESHLRVALTDDEIKPMLRALYEYAKQLAPFAATALALAQETDFDEVQRLRTEVAQLKVDMERITSG